MHLEMNCAQPDCKGNNMKPLKYNYVDTPKPRHPVDASVCPVVIKNVHYSTFENQDTPLFRTLAKCLPC